MSSTILFPSVISYSPIYPPINQLLQLMQLLLQQPVFVILASRKTTACYPICLDKLPEGSQLMSKVEMLKYEAERTMAHE